MLSNTGINKIILLGQVSNEAELKRSANNQRHWCFTLVTVEAIKKGSDTVEHHEYHNIKISEKLVEFEAFMLETGQTLYIEGKIQTTSFVDQIGVKRYNLEILASKVEAVKSVPIVA